MTVRVKICGINSAEAMQAACGAGADWIGFVLFERSPRFVPATTAAGLSALVPGGPARVGLFVDPRDDDIARALSTLRLDILQVYAPEPRVADIRARFHVPVWQSVGIAGVADLPRRCAADALVIEAAAPPGADRPGGNARTLDWSMLSGWRAPAEWLLAGGLDAGNVARAIALSGATSVDVSSGVETAPGRKDKGLIQRFVAAAKGCSVMG